MESPASNYLENRPQDGSEDNSDTGGPDTKSALNYAKHAHFAGQAALERLEKQQTSSLLTKTKTSRNPSQEILLSLEKSDVRIERLLGEGAYASVLLVSVPKLGSPAKDDGDNLSEISIDISENGSPTKDEENEQSLEGLFAMKRLDPNKLHDEKDFQKGARELVTEAFILSHLQHENIVQLRGIAAGNVDAAFEQPGGYFLIMEALEQTFDVLLDQWRELDSRKGGFFFKKKKNALIPSLHHRMSLIALQICKGMEYLHKQHVMFRDFKPHNIGMGQDGKIKIFNFGLAREVPPVPGQTEVMIKGTAGSLRYIAPENILGDGCFFPGDVYSFGVLLWELLSLDVPFENMSRPSHFEVEMATEGYRPNIRRVGAVPKSVKVLIQDCWDEDRSVRPTFSEVREVLESVKKRGESRSRRRGPLSMFRLPGSRTTTKAAPENVSAIGTSKRRVRKSPSETDLTNTDGE